MSKDSLQVVVDRARRKERREFAKAYKSLTGREPKWWGTGIFAWRLWCAARTLP